MCDFSFLGAVIEGIVCMSGCRGVDPWEYVLTPPPENITFFYSKLLLYNCKFHNIKGE